MSFGWSVKTLIGTIVFGLLLFIINLAVVATGVESDFSVNSDFNQFLITDEEGYSGSPRLLNDNEVSVYDLRLESSYITTQAGCVTFNGTWTNTTTFLFFFEREVEAYCDGLFPLSILTDGLIIEPTENHTSPLSIIGSIADAEWDNLIEDNMLEGYVANGTLPSYANICRMPFANDDQAQAEILGCTWYEPTREELGDPSISDGFSMWGLLWETVSVMFTFDVDYNLGEPWDMLLNIVTVIVTLLFIASILYILLEILSLIPFVGS